MTDRSAQQRSRIRHDLAAILKLQTELRWDARAKSYAGEHEDGPPLGGEAMVHLGPQAPWALQDQSEPTPEVEIIWWEHAARQALGHPAATHPTLAAAVAYLTDHLPDLGDLDITKLADRARSLRARLEDTLSAGLRDLRGVPCVQCGRTLVRRCQPLTGLSDDWECTGCRRTLTAAEYWQAVRSDYLIHADALPADELAAKLGIRPNLIRVWGARGKVSKRGKSITGTTLYDVNEATALATDSTQTTDIPPSP